MFGAYGKYIFIIFAFEPGIGFAGKYFWGHVKLLWLTAYLDCEELLLGLNVFFMKSARSEASKANFCSFLSFSKSVDTAEAL
jgi:hypothetical protein